MYIWIVNPFEEFPVSGTRSLRYGTLCRVLAERGHEVIWWSSDFSHLTKKRRPVPLPTFGFAYHLISTPQYQRHIGVGRWRNHRAFAKGFFRSGRAAVEAGDLMKPDLVLTSLPPLGIAREAFRLRDVFGCRVVVDIVDAWPETFLRLVPGGGAVGRILLKPLFVEAARAYRSADGITAVARTFLELPKRAGSSAPTHLTYLGGELKDRGPKSEVGSQRPEGGDRQAEDGEEKEGESVQRLKNEESGDTRAAPDRQATKDKRQITSPVTRFVYIGAMARSYDLETLLEAAKRLKQEGAAFELHLAGAGPKEKNLRAFSETHNLREHVSFQGYLKSDALKALLVRSHVAINPIFDDSWIVFPYKMSEYLAAGLAVINSLSGEVKELLSIHDAGSWYPAGDAEALAVAMKEYCDNPGLAVRQGGNARSLAEREFNRAKTYPQLAEFLEGIAKVI